MMGGPVAGRRPARMQPAKIETPSKRQAMDWSLVLLSQGIESVIEYQETEANWSLLVPPEQQTEARASLQTYEQENRGWPWQQPILQETALFDWASVGWVFLIAVFFLLDESRSFQPVGTLSGEAVRHGEWWRCFTAVWLHADLAHLTGNAVFGCLLLGLALGRYGTGVGLLAAYLSGAAANWVRFLAVPDTRMGLGASGMVMGALGLLAVQYVPAWGMARQPVRYVVGGLSAGVMLFVLLGVAPQSDVLVHAAGFGFGLLIGVLLNFGPPLKSRRRVYWQLAWGVLFILLVVVPWAFAWRSSSIHA
jgi:rhomboid protease GluP